MNQKIHNTRLQLLDETQSIVLLRKKEHFIFFLCCSSTFLSYLTHLSDGVIKHASGIVGSFSDKLDLPGSRRQAQLEGIQTHYLLGNLNKDRLARTPSVGVRKY